MAYAIIIQTNIEKWMKLEKKERNPYIYNNELLLPTVQAVDIFYYKNTLYLKFN